MQADVPVIHGQKSHRQHQRNGDTHHQARPHVNVVALPKGQRRSVVAFVQAQADEAHRQHDQHRLNQHADELIDRTCHRLGLVLQLHQLDAGRQTGFQAGAHLGQRFTQADNVTALGHRDTQGHDFTALVMHLDRWRIGIAAVNIGNLAQARLAARGAAHRHGLDLLDRLKLPAHANLQHVLRCLQGACELDRVLLAELA